MEWTGALEGEKAQGRAGERGGSASRAHGLGRHRRSEASRAFAEDGRVKTHIGGQALLGGVMMRGRDDWAAAVRTPEGGVYVEEHPLSGGRRWRRVPVVRGCFAFVDSLVVGYKALEVSVMHGALSVDEGSDDADEANASVSSAEEAGADGRAAGPADSAAASGGQDDADEGFDGKDMAVSMAVGIAIGLALFIVAPALLANALVGDYGRATLAWNLVDGLVRVAVFVAYIWGIGRMRDMQEMFSHHGAEHKTIHCYEHGLPLTPENARSFPRLHVRCGTAFLIMVMLIAILVYALVPLGPIVDAIGVPDGAPKLVALMVARVLLLPLIAGLSYEVTVKWAGSHPENPLVKVVLWPGMQMQRLTTREPDDGQLECAIRAMRRVLVHEAAEGDAEAASYLAAEQAS